MTKKWLISVQVRHFVNLVHLELSRSLFVSWIVDKVKTRGFLIKYITQSSMIVLRVNMINFQSTDTLFTFLHPLCTENEGPRQTGPRCQMPDVSRSYHVIKAFINAASPAPMVR